MRNRYPLNPIQLFLFFLAVVLAQDVSPARADDYDYTEADARRMTLYQGIAGSVLGAAALATDFDNNRRVPVPDPRHNTLRVLTRAELEDMARFVEDGIRSGLRRVEVSFRVSFGGSIERTESRVFVGSQARGDGLIRALEELQSHPSRRISDVSFRVVDEAPIALRVAQERLAFIAFIFGGVRIGTAMIRYAFLDGGERICIRQGGIRARYANDPGHCEVAPIRALLFGQNYAAGE